MKFTTILGRHLRLATLGQSILMGGAFFAGSSVCPAVETLIFSESWENGGDNAWSNGFGTYAGNNYSDSPHSAVPNAGTNYGTMIGSGLAGGETTSVGTTTTIIDLSTVLNAAELGEVAAGNRSWSWSGWLASWTGDTNYAEFEVQWLDINNQVLATQTLADGSVVDFASEVILSDGSTSTDITTDWNGDNWTLYEKNGDVPAGAAFAQITYIGNGNDAYTDELSLSIIDGASSTVAISQQPVGGVIPFGNNFQFDIEIFGFGASYQWFFDNGLGGGPVALVDASEISGATTPSLAVSNIGLAAQGDYFCVVTAGDGGGAMSTSDAATLSLALVAEPPTSLSLFEGSSASFSIGTTNPLDTYQWYFDDGISGSPVALVDGPNVSGATTTSLVRSNITILETGNYFCRVDRNGTSEDSSAASLQITATPTGNTIFYSEGFDGLVLDNTDGRPSESGEMMDFTRNLPDGWTRTENSAGSDDDPEYYGWIALDASTGAGWTFQNRDDFQRGSCNIMVADPDEAQAFGHLPLDSTIESGTIPVTGATANAMVFRFDSSFRPYDDMTGAVEVSYDGGTSFTEVFRIKTDLIQINGVTLNPETVNAGTPEEEIITANFSNSSRARTNFQEEIPLANPAGDFDLKFRFKMFEADNDWWWAFDNVVIYEGTGVPSIVDAPDTLQILGGDPAAADLGFSVVPEGPGPFTFAWSFDNGMGGGPIALADGGIYSGTATADLSIASPSTSEQGRYFVTATSAGGSVSSCADFRILPLSFVAQPDGRAGTNALIAGAELLFIDTSFVTFEENFSFRLLRDSGGGNFVEVPNSAGDSTNPPVEWFIDSVQNPNTGQWSHILTYSTGLEAEESDIGTYKVEITNIYGTVESNEAIFDVTAVAFVTLPQTTVGEVGSAVSLTARADSIESPFTYQWYRGIDNLDTPEDERTPVDGAAGDALDGSGNSVDVTLDFANLSLADSGYYSVDFTIPSATVSSPPAFVGVPNPTRIFEGTTTYFEETFDGLPLEVSPEEDPDNEDLVWTRDNAPTGWTADNSRVPGFGNPDLDGITEWSGWSFADATWWATVAGDQARTDFTNPETGLGGGNILIIDPDEWDDAPHNPGELYTFLTTGSIDLSSVTDASVAVSFDSSFRPYDDMTGTVEYALDGGEFQQLYFLDTIELGGQSLRDRTNERVSIEVPLNGASAMHLRFGMITAGNDWWWAVDDIRVSDFLGAPIEITETNYDASSDIFEFSFSSEIGKDYKVQYLDLETNSWVNINSLGNAGIITAAANSTPVLMNLPGLFPTSGAPNKLLVRVVLN